MDLLKGNAAQQRLAKARGILTGENLSLVLVSPDNVYRRTGRGIAPLFDLLENVPAGELRRSALADKVVGRAAGLLIIGAKIPVIYSTVMNATAAQLMREAGIMVHASQFVSQIMNREGTGPCPLELLTVDITNPGHAHREIASQLVSWMQVDDKIDDPW